MFSSVVDETFKTRIALGIQLYLIRELVKGERLCAGDDGGVAAASVAFGLFDLADLARGPVSWATVVELRQGRQCEITGVGWAAESDEELTVRLVAELLDVLRWSGTRSIGARIARSDAHFIELLPILGFSADGQPDGEPGGDDAIYLALEP